MSLIPPPDRATNPPARGSGNACLSSVLGHGLVMPNYLRTLWLPRQVDEWPWSFFLSDLP